MQQEPLLWFNTTDTAVIQYCYHASTIPHQKKNIGNCSDNDGYAEVKAESLTLWADGSEWTSK